MLALRSLGEHGTSIRCSENDARSTAHHASFAFNSSTAAGANVGPEGQGRDAVIRDAVQHENSQLSASRSPGLLGGLPAQERLEGRGKLEAMVALEPSASAPLRIVMVDDHPILRSGLRGLLAAEADFEVVGEAGDSVGALEMVARLKPDLVLMDFSMPGVNGAETTRILKRKYPAISVLALSVHEEVGFVQMLLDAGASGYALKRSACDELVRASRIVAAGGTYVDPSLTGALLRLQESIDGKSARSGLSERKAEVARLLAHGLTMKEIAAQLDVSPRTLETYRARAMDKLRLKSRADLVRFALRCGWLKG